MESRKYRFIFAGLLLAAAFFRIFHLGVPAFRADTILFWELAQRKVPIVDLVTRWFEVSGAIGQMPLAGVFMQLFLTFWPGELTPFAVRLPFALFGIAAVVAAYKLGKTLGGRRFGFALMAWVAVSPFAVYHSREAYVYAPILFGYYLFALAFFKLWFRIEEKTAPAVGEWVLLAIAIFFCTYSQVTGVFIIAAAFPMLLWKLWRQKDKAFFRKVGLVLVAIHAVVMIPLLVVGWGYTPIFKQILDNAAHAQQATNLSGEKPFPGVFRMIAQMSMGTTVIGWATLLAAVAASAWSLRSKKPSALPAAGLLVLIQVVLFLVSRSTAGAALEPRYLSGIFPFLAIWMVYGLVEAPAALPSIGRAFQQKPALGLALLALPLGLGTWLSYVTTNLTGKPTPYYDIVRWCDSNLPRGTPVIVDRWFEPWNELKAHPTTNVVFTFTVPNEPVQQYLSVRWRDTARTFFEKFPDAAYLEISKQYFDVAGVGVWEWPRRHFARHVGITNEAGLLLRKWGVAPRGDFYWSTTNRVVVDLFYNTKEDLLQKWRQEGKPFHILYGPGWQFTKTQDYRDWRVLNDKATVEVVNLTDKAAAGRLRIRGVAVNGPKRVRIVQGVEHEFPAQKLDEWTFGPFEIPPGVNAFLLQDVLAPLTQTPLLVESMELTTQ
jgi:hypothetical protein